MAESMGFDHPRVPDRGPTTDFAPFVTVAVGLCFVGVALAAMFNIGPFAGLVASSKTIDFGKPVTVRSQATVQGKTVETKARLTVYAARQYAISKTHRRPVNVSVEVVNDSAVALVMLGNQQSLTTSGGGVVHAQPTKFTIPAGTTRKIVFTFLISPQRTPGQMSIEIAGQKTGFELKFTPVGRTDD